MTEYPDAVGALRSQVSRYGWSTERVEDYLLMLSKDGQPTAYLFRCRHCVIHLAYSDFA